VLCFVSRSEARPTMSGCVSGGATTSFVIVTSADVPSFTSRLSFKLVARFAPPMAGSDIGGTPRSSKGTWPGGTAYNLSAFSAQQCVTVAVSLFRWLRLPSKPCHVCQHVSSLGRGHRRGSRKTAVSGYAEEGPIQL
jgi:hypothetical protein